MLNDQRLKNVKPATRYSNKNPLWKGPEDSSERGGITFSMLSRYLCCHERFRLYAIEGLRNNEGFNHKIEYGTMWHVCEEALAKLDNEDDTDRSILERVNNNLLAYAKELVSTYRLSQEQVKHWYEVCKRQFPIYVDFWKNNPEVIARQPLLQEQVFHVPYKLPSGRIVYLKGKWDSVDLIQEHKDTDDTTYPTGIWLQENKTKGTIDEVRMQQQLTFDLQTMMYVVALKDGINSYASNGAHPVLGVRYNVIRRPLSGGKGTIKQKQNETKDEYYSRLASYIHEEPKTYFMRWKVSVSDRDINTFKDQCFDNLLEQVCRWYDDVTNKVPKEIDQTNFRYPYGVYNPTFEGTSTDYDNYLATGSEVGLQRVNELFRELRV